MEPISRKGGRVATQVICRIDCIHNSRLPTGRCMCNVIGVEIVDGMAVCDSYMKTPAILRAKIDEERGEG